MKNLIKSFISISALFLPGFALAHTGVGGMHGWLSGIGHPFSGFDHLCAMIAVGLWAAQMGGKATWRVPITFVAVMAIGGVFGMAGFELPFIEGGIAASLLVLGMLITVAVRLPLAASTTIVGVFAVFHGFAHGTEMPRSATGIGYALGFILSTIFLHAIGIILAWYARHTDRLEYLRYAGGLVATGGAYLWLTL